MGMEREVKGGEEGKGVRRGGKEGEGRGSTPYFMQARLLSICFSFSSKFRSLPKLKLDESDPNRRRGSSPF